MKNSSKPTFFVAISVILLIHTSVSNAAFHFEDDFEDGIINPTAWIIDDPPGGVALAETGGVLSATAPVIGYFDEATLTLSYILGGKFDVQYDYQWLSPAVPRTRTYLGAYSMNNDESFGINFWRGGTPNGDMMWDHYVAGIGYPIGHKWNPPTSGKMRIRRDIDKDTGTGTFTGYYWSSGWVSLGSATGFTDEVRIELHANTNGTSTMNLQWDNFIADADTPEPCTLLLLSLGGCLCLRKRIIHPAKLPSNKK